MKKHILVDNRQSSYGPFFKDNAIQEAMESSRCSGSLRECLFDLLADWRSVSYAGALPALIPNALKDFHDAFVNAEASAPDILKFSDVILKKVEESIEQVSDDPDLQEKLRKSLISISHEILQANRQVKQTLDGEALWQMYLEMIPFHLGLHGTMKLGYLAVYGAYENFIVRCISLALPNESIRISTSAFNKQLRRAFSDLAESIWFDQDVRVARGIRNALLHTGGRITKELIDLKNIPVRVQDGHLHVFPEDIANLYHQLKIRVVRIIKDDSFQE